MMLQLDPQARPTLAEIRSHKWFNLPVPTHEEVKNEFRLRLEIISNISKRTGEDMPEVSPNPDIFNGTGKFRSSALQTQEEEIETTVTVDRVANEYIPEMINCTHFFSTASLSDLFNILALYANKSSKEYSFSDEDYSVTMRISLEDASVVVSGAILKVPNEDIH